MSAAAAEVETAGAASAATSAAGATTGRGGGELPRLLLPGLLDAAAAAEAAAETAEAPSPADHDGGQAETGDVPNSGLEPPGVGDPPLDDLLVEWE